MAVGSDSGHRFNPQAGIAVEMELMVEAGFDAMQAVQSATSIGARAIGLGDVAGQLAAGMYADILVIDGDPLADIKVLQDATRIERVYKAGKLLAGTAYADSRPPVPGGGLE